MLKKSFLCFFCLLLLAFQFVPAALATSAEYQTISDKTQGYLQTAAPLYADGTHSPDFWSAFAARKAYLVNDEKYKFLLPQKDALTVAEDSTAPQLADLILKLYISMQDPTDLKGQNLPQKLANMGKVNGSFGEGLTAVDQAKIIMALEWTETPYFKEQALDYLVSYRGEGGLLMNADGVENVESTAWGLMASSLCAYTESFTEQLEIALKTSISAEGYFCSEAETPSCTVQALAIVALCFANVNLASDSYSKVLTAFHNFEMADGSFSETLTEPKTHHAATLKAWTAVGLVKEMYQQLENTKVEEDQTDEQDPFFQTDSSLFDEEDQSPVNMNNTANRRFPTGVAIAGGVCLVLILVLLFWRKK